MTDLTLDDLERQPGCLCTFHTSPDGAITRHFNNCPTCSPRRPQRQPLQPSDDMKPVVVIGKSTGRRRQPKRLGWRFYVALFIIVFLAALGVMTTLAGNPFFIF